MEGYEVEVVKGSIKTIEKYQPILLIEISDLKKFNLLNQKKIFRKVIARSNNKEVYRKKALKFDKEYVDGTREEGYGGYRYDGRSEKGNDERRDDAPGSLSMPDQRRNSCT